jgi:Papain fold toxin 1, glutamine deamidase
MPAHRKYLPWLAAAVSLVATTQAARAQLKGGVTITVPPKSPVVSAGGSPDVFSTNDACAGRDPLKGRCQLMPKVVQGRQTRCVPPDKSWQLVAERGNYCYYYAPYPAGPIRGRVVDIQQCPALEFQGGRCAANPNDPTNTTAVYTPPGWIPNGTSTAPISQSQPPSTSNWPPRGSMPNTAPPRWPPQDNVPAPTILDRTKMLQLAAQMDKAASESKDSAHVAFDHFFIGLAEWAGRTLRFLAQKPGQPLGQMAQDIANYLTNDYNQNDQALRNAAVQAIQQMQGDPARFWGQNLPNLLPLPRLQAIQEIEQVELGAQRISTVAREGETFGSEFGSGAASRTPHPSSASYGGSQGLACFAQNSCVPTAIAQDQLWAAGETYQIQGVHPISGPDLAMTGGQVEQTLRQRYHGAAALNNPYFTPAQRLALQQGIPVPVSSVQDITNAVRAGGNNSRGMVFIRHPNGTGHVFNVRNMNGTVQFWDATQRMDGSLWFALPLQDVFFYPTA